MRGTELHITCANDEELMRAIKVIKSRSAFKNYRKDTITIEESLNGKWKPDWPLAIQLIELYNQGCCRLRFFIFQSDGFITALLKSKLKCFKDTTDIFLFFEFTYFYRDSASIPFLVPNLEVDINTDLFDIDEIF